ncbi:Uncharacterised protein [Mycobacterium tuberculosis]|nr:Uncharacterised protein [Mycobacterium tuberculosis]
MGLLSSVATAYSTNKVAPVATRALVRNPAIRARHWRSSPIMAPQPTPTASRRAKSATVSVCMTPSPSRSQDGHGSQPRAG